MSNPVFDQTIAPMRRTLKILDSIVAKAEAHLAENEDIEPETLLRARLFPNMLDFVFQIRVATDIAKGKAATESPAG